MKALKENVKTIAAYAEADAENAEGFAAWALSDTARLEQLAMTGTLGNSFYAGEKEVVGKAAALLERCDAPALAAAIVKGRNEGFIRAFPILGLVYLSKKDAGIFQETFGKVVHTGNDLSDFIETAKSVRGLGRSVKRAISGWLAKNVNAFYAQKYRRQLADAIRLVRYKGEDTIYAYILKAYRGVKGVTAEKIERAYAEYPDLAAHRDFSEAMKSGNLRNAEALLREKDIDVNSLTVHYGKFDKGLWAALAARSPVMRFVKYMGKFIREGVLTEELLKEKVNVHSLKKAKVFPFRLYAAYVSVQKGLKAGGLLKKESDIPTGERADLGGSAEAAGVQGICRMALGHLSRTMDEYAQAYDWSVFDGGKWVIAPDVSGSMASRVGKSSDLTYADISGMFTGFLMRGLKDVTVLPWHERVVDYPCGADAAVMEHIAAIRGMTGGGTYMEAAVQHMLSMNIAADYAVFITDTEEYGKGWMQSWKEYHRKHPEAIAFVLRGDSYNTSPIPEDAAKELNVHQIFGWNDSVVDYMKFVAAKRKETVRTRGEASGGGKEAGQ